MLKPTMVFPFHGSQSIESKLRVENITSGAPPDNRNVIAARSVLQPPFYGRFADPWRTAEDEEAQEVIVEIATSADGYSPSGWSVSWLDRPQRKDTTEGAFMKSTIPSCGGERRTPRN